MAAGRLPRLAFLALALCAPALEGAAAPPAHAANDKDGKTSNPRACAVAKGGGLVCPEHGDTGEDGASGDHGDAIPAVTPVPLPPSVFLLGGAVGALGLWRRRRAAP